MSYMRSEFNFKELFQRLSEIESSGISGTVILNVSPVLKQEHSKIIRTICNLIPDILGYEEFVNSLPQGKEINELEEMNEERKAGYLNEVIRQYVAFSDMSINLDVLVKEYNHTKNTHDSYNRAWLIKAMKGKDVKIKKILQSIRKYISSTGPSIAWLREYFYDNGPKGGHLTGSSLLTYMKSKHYKYSEIMLAYVNSAPKDMITYIQENLIKGSKNAFELNDILMRLSPKTLSPTDLLNAVANDDRNMEITKKIVDRYKEQGLNFDILNSITPNSLESFDYMIDHGYDKTEDTNVCVSRICQLPASTGINKRRKTLMTFMKKGRRLSCPSVVAMICMSNNAPDLFEYLLSIRAFGDLNSNANLLMDIVSDLMKFEVFDYFDLMKRYYVIPVGTLIKFEEKLDGYMTLRDTYSKEAQKWLRETIETIKMEEYTIK